MFELNDYELEYVAGGHHARSYSNAQGTGSTDLGITLSRSLSDSEVDPQGRVHSHAQNETTSIGLNPIASSSTDSGAEAS